MTLRIESRVGVQASAERIWDLLVDFDNWPRWNPVESEIAAHLGIGAPLQLIERIPGLPERAVTARLGDWRPQAQLLWSEKRGLWFAATRYYDIETLAEKNCIVSHGLILTGLRGESFHDKHRKTIRSAYQQISDALKLNAES